LNRQDAKNAKKSIFEPPRRQGAKNADVKIHTIFFNRLSWRLGALAVQTGFYLVAFASWRFKKIIEQDYP
jgi:hypothetical protein